MQIPGTNIASRIAPFDTADTFATHDSQWGRDGYRSVADLTERDAISDARRKEGMLVYVITTDTTYQLYGGITNSNWRTYASTIYGTVSCDTSSYIYYVYSPRINNDAIINTTFKIPSVDSVLYECSVTNVTSGSFTMVLSDTPETSGYYINWVVMNPS
jgi:hypothetical protein